MNKKTIYIIIFIALVIGFAVMIYFVFFADLVNPPTNNDNLNDNGFCIIGTPNISASQYACEASRLGHVNLHDQQRLKELFLKKFRNVFVFNCNDEMIHTGYDKMSHYFIALCVK